MALFVPPDYLNGRTGGNFVLVASPRAFDTASMLSAMRGRGGNEAVLTGTAIEEFAATGIVLTDDYAPVDQMLLS